MCGITSLERELFKTKEFFFIWYFVSCPLLTNCSLFFSPAATMPKKEGHRYMWTTSWWEPKQLVLPLTGKPEIFNGVLSLKMPKHALAMGKQRKDAFVFCFVTPISCMIFFWYHWHCPVMITMIKTFMDALVVLRSTVVRYRSLRLHSLRCLHQRPLYQAETARSKQTPQRIQHHMER